MKRILLLTVLLFGGLSMFAQTQRMVLLEEFTNASCGPCAQQNPEFTALIDANPTLVAAIKFQTAGPGYDPQHHDAPADIQATIGQRATLYAISGVPSATVDGLLPDDTYAGGVGRWDQAYQGAPFGINQAVVDYASAIMSPIAINMSFNIDISVTPNVLTTNLEIINAMPTDLAMAGNVLQVMMVEEKNVFPFSPGTNGETEFFDVFRGMVNGAAGMALTDTLPAGDTMRVEFSVELRDFIYDISNIGLVAFVQNSSNLDVMQAAKAASLDFPTLADASIEGSIVAAGSNCDYAATAVAQLTNTTMVEINEAVVALLDESGNLIASETYMGALLMGETFDIVFSDFTEVGPGTNAYRIVLTSVNGVNGDLRRLNNLTASFTVSKWEDVPAFDDGFSFDLEGIEATDIPANTYVVRPRVFQLGVATTQWLTDILNGSAFPVNGPAGGFGNSDGSIIIDFWRWDVSAFDPVGSLSMDKIDLSERKDAQLTFDINHALYAADGTDRVEVLISTDCGATSTMVYGKEGADLATSAITTDFYTPRPADWRTETIDLSAYDGMGEVNVIFKFISGWGNNVFIDNINVTSEMVVGNNELTEVNSLDLYPNPAVSSSNVSISLNERTNLNIEVTDYTGRVIEQLVAGQEYRAGNHNFSIDTESYNSGVYFVKIQTNSGESVRKLNVVK